MESVGRFDLSKYEKGCMLCKVVEVSEKLDAGRENFVVLSRVRIGLVA